MEPTINTTSEREPVFRLVIVARRQLDADGLAALCLDRAELRVLCATNNTKMASIVCRHRRPDAVLLDAGFIGHDGCPSVPAFLDQIGEFPIMLLDDEVNDARLATILKMPCVGYFTRTEAFTEIVVGIKRLTRGERAFAPSVAERLQLTTHGWQLRRDDSRSPLATLTPREVEVMRLIALGNTIKSCADALKLSPSTVDNHKSRLMKKLGVHRSLDLTRLALREGLVRL